MPCRNLRAEMARKKVSIEDIAECLQIHRNSASLRLPIPKMGFAP